MKIPSSVKGKMLAALGISVLAGVLSEPAESQAAPAKGKGPAACQVGKPSTAKPGATKAAGTAANQPAKTGAGCVTQATSAAGGTAAAPKLSPADAAAAERARIMAVRRAQLQAQRAQQPKVSPGATANPQSPPKTHNCGNACGRG